MVSVWVPVILMARIVLQTSSGDKCFSTWCLVLDSDHTTVMTSSNRAMTAVTDPNRSHWHMIGFVNFPSWSPWFLFFYFKNSAADCWGMCTQRFFVCGIHVDLELHVDSTRNPCLIRAQKTSCAHTLILEAEHQNHTGTENRVVVNTLYQ